MPEFTFEHLLPGAGGNGEAQTPWRLLTTDGVSSVGGPDGVRSSKWPRKPCAC
jgi:fumarate hydratase class I